MTKQLFEGLHVALPSCELSVLTCVTFHSVSTVSPVSCCLTGDGNCKEFYRDEFAPSLTSHLAQPPAVSPQDTGLPTPICHSPAGNSHELPQHHQSHPHPQSHHRLHAHTSTRWLKLHRTLEGFSPHTTFIAATPPSLCFRYDFLCKGCKMLIFIRCVTCC